MFLPLVPAPVTLFVRGLGSTPDVMPDQCVLHVKVQPPWHRLHRVPYIALLIYCNSRILNTSPPRQIVYCTVLHLTMDNPIQDCRSVVHVLTQGSPKQQEEAINTYFTPNASFTHPFCRTGSFDNSRLLIHSIFRWYKIMSPKIDLKINSVGTLPQTLSPDTSIRTNEYL